LAAGQLGELLCSTSFVQQATKALSHVRKSAGALLRSGSAATTATGPSLTESYTTALLAKRDQERPRALCLAPALAGYDCAQAQLGAPTRRYQSCFLTYIRVWILCAIDSERRLRKSARENADVERSGDPYSEFPGADRIAKCVYRYTQPSVRASKSRCAWRSSFAHVTVAYLSCYKSKKTFFLTRCSHMIFLIELLLKLNLTFRQLIIIIIK